MAPPNVPILGQPYILANWFTCVIIVCNMCDNHSVLTLVGSNPATCPACKTVFQMAQLEFDIQQPIETTKIILAVARGVEKGGN